MSEDGYTLVEMLVALAIIGLAFGGLTDGARIIGKLQAQSTQASADALSRRLADQALQRVLVGAGPFLSSGTGGFHGDQHGFSFACANSGACGARVESEGSKSQIVTFESGRVSSPAIVTGAAEFRYADQAALGPVWPTAKSPTTALRAISLVEASDQDYPIATVRISTDEPATCVFDVVAQACRAAP